MQSVIFEVYCEIVCGLLKAVYQVYLEPTLKGTSSVFFIFRVFLCLSWQKIYLVIKQRGFVKNYSKMNQIFFGLLTNTNKYPSSNIVHIIAGLLYAHPQF